MVGTEHVVRSIFDSAASFALAFTGIVVIVFPAIALADAVLGSPLGRLVLAVSALAGVLGAGAFVVVDNSVSRLWRFVGVTYASSFGWLFLVAGVMQLAGVPIPAGDRRPFLYAGLLAIATAYVGVYSDVVDASTETQSASSFGAS